MGNRSRVPGQIGCDHETCSDMFVKRLRHILKKKIIHTWYSDHISSIMWQPTILASGAHGKKHGGLLHIAMFLLTISTTDVWCMFGSNRFRKPEINYRAEEKKILDSVLGAEVYDNRIRPSGLNSTGKSNHSSSRDLMSWWDRWEKSASASRSVRITSQDSKYIPST